MTFVAEQPLDLLYISAVTLAEIRFGIELAKDANRRNELNTWLTNKVRPLFAQRVLEVTEDALFCQKPRDRRISFGEHTPRALCAGLEQVS